MAGWAGMGTRGASDAMDGGATAEARGPEKTGRRQAVLGLCVGLLAWVPLFVTSLAEQTTFDGRGSFTHDIGVHARLLLALPLAVWAEHPIHRRVRHALRYLHRAGLIGDGNEPAARTVVARARALLGLRSIEVALVVAALALSSVEVAQRAEPIPTWWRAGEGWDLTSAGWIYVAVSAPIARFVGLVWVWRFAVWSGVLVGLARARLRIDPAHPDGSGGLSVLFGAQTSFGWLVLAAAVALVGNVWTETLVRQQSVLEHWQLAGTFALVAPLLVLMPLFAFSVPLERARQQFHQDYGTASADFAARYAQAWIAEKTRSELPLGTSETSAHTDLVSSFDRVAQTSWIPFRKRDLGLLVAAAVIPFLVLMASEMPLVEVLVRIHGRLSG